MERSLNRPSYVLALLLGVIALVDAGGALLAMQTPGPCSRSSFSGVGCGSNAGWVIDLAAAGISAALVAFLLTRPHLYVFGVTVGWAALAFIANFALRNSGTIDAPATYRMTAYFVVLVIAGVLLVVEGKPRWDAERAKRPVAQMPPRPLLTRLLRACSTRPLRCPTRPPRRTSWGLRLLPCLRPHRLSSLRHPSSPAHPPIDSPGLRAGPPGVVLGPPTTEED
jgi:hypothetical protein